MDKIITFIIILYVIFKFFSRLLSGDEGEKKGTSRQPPPIPSHRKVPSPTSKTKPGPAPRQDFPSSWHEVGQILRDLKREAEGEQEAIKTPEKTPIPRQEVSVAQHTKRIEDDQKDRPSIQKKIHPKRLAEERGSLAKAKTIREEKPEGAEISFDQPGLFLQGIILSEILRPPMARRNHLMPPYLRG